MAKHWNIAESRLVDDEGDPVSLMPSLAGLKKPQALALVVADGYLIRPDVSALAGVPERYWKVVANALVEMTQLEKDAVDAVLAAAQLENEKDAAKVEVDMRLLRAMSRVIVQWFSDVTGAINTERAEHGRAAITPRTPSQFRQAVINEIDAQTE